MYDFYWLDCQLIVALHYICRLIVLNCVEEFVDEDEDDEGFDYVEDEDDDFDYVEDDCEDEAETFVSFR